MNTHWRSRDLYKAWFMNVYALTDLQKTVADAIAAKRASRSASAATLISATRCTSTAATSTTPLSRSRRCARLPSPSGPGKSTHPAFEMMTQEARQKLAQDPDWFAKARG